MAGWKNHEVVAELLLDNGADTSAKGNKGDIPANDARKERYSKFANIINSNSAPAITTNVPPPTRITDQSTNAISGLELWKAAVRGNLGMVNRAIATGTNVNWKSFAGRTSLHATALYNRPAVTSALLTAGADKDAQNKDGETPLHMVSYRGSKDVARIIITAGADIEIKDKYGYTPLLKAALLNHTDLAELLLNNGADASVKASYDSGQGSTYDWTPLHYAALRNNLVLAELLLNHEADTSAKDVFYWTPLDIASHLNHVAMVELLQNNGAEPSAKHDSDNTLNENARKRQTDTW
ncbi:unnamed protein product, partial [Meganyctiphanes norvegica]